MTARRSSFENGLAASLKQSGLLEDHHHLLVAVSGGADSVALLRAMHALKQSFGLHVTVAHLNHQLRGAEGRHDAAFVEDLAQTLHVSCVTGASDVKRLATRKGISLEMAAREARYRFLARSARDSGATAIATAHTADDQAETVMLRLARGSGKTGLSGIRPAGWVSELGLGIRAPGIALLRPLLDVSRAEIEAYLKRLGQGWREDASNASMAFLRNRVRHEVLPLLERRLNPCMRTALCRTAEIVAEEDALMHGLAEDALSACSVEKGALQREALDHHHPALARRVVQKWLMEQGVDPDVIDFGSIERIRRLARDGSGTRAVALCGPWRVVRRYGVLTVECTGSAPEPFRVGLRGAGETLLPEWGLRVVVARSKGIVREAGDTPGQLPASASLSARAVGRCRLYLRTPHRGDRMRPYGMQGSRKLQDIIVDAKVPADARAAVPILECRGQVAWVPGYRIAHPFRLAHADSPALRITIERL